MEHLSEFEALDLLMAIVILVLGVWITWGILVARRRRRLLSTTFPDKWLTIIKRNLPVYSRLPENLKKQLRGLINVFLTEKSFEGCGGLEITDEIRVTIAAQACVLLLNRQTNIYPKLTFILVYPSVYFAEGPTRVGDLVINMPSARLGESWLRGSLVLAWDHVKHGGVDPRDGQNVVYHEFAHQLDQESGASDGAPPLDKTMDHAVWAKVLGEEYEKLRYKVSHHVRDVMDAYGATNPAEFFAVATETFLEKPSQMKRKHPKLYQELRDYYHFDPGEWTIS